MNVTTAEWHLLGNWSQDEIAAIEALLQPRIELFPGNPWTIQKEGGSFKAKRNSWDIYAKANSLADLIEYLTIYYKAFVGTATPDVSTQNRPKTITAVRRTKPHTTTRHTSKHTRHKQTNPRGTKPEDRLCPHCGGRDFYKDGKCKPCRSKERPAKNPHKGPVLFPCSHCKSSTLIRRGKNRDGSQRYICTTCNKYCKEQPA